jgi:hypothetical protein
MFDSPAKQEGQAALDVQTALAHRFGRSARADKLETELV